MPSLLLYGFVALAIMGALGGISYRIYHAGAESVRLEWEQAKARAREEADARAGDASQGLEVNREKARIVYRTITKQVDKIVDRPVYRNVCLDDDGLRAVRSAIAGRLAAPAAKPDAAVPAARTD